MADVLTTLAERYALPAQELEAFNGVNLHRMRSSVSEALSHIGRLGLLEEYTKHDMSHIDSMLDMYSWLIPDETKQTMSPADWLLLTLSTYLHDFGMLVTRAEFESRHTTDFSAYKERIFANQDPAHMDYRAQLGAMDEQERERFLYQEFVRENHAPRVRSWLGENPDGRLGFDEGVCDLLRQLFDGVEETFKEDVGLVCESHHLDDLQDSHKYPISRPYGRTTGEEANVQYAALLLRTADLLHITKDRVPSTAALIVSPRNPKSQVEWAKQAAVRSVRAQPVKPVEGATDRKLPDTIEVHATFRESEGFFGLTTYLNYAAEQLAQTHAWARASQAENDTRYVFPWRRIDTENIEAKGFIAEPFQFRLDQAKILDLLTGHTLYNDTGVVLRELLQNSLDAVRLQQLLLDSSRYSSHIEVFWDSESRVLTIADNGTGMTQEVIEQNFLRVGASRYQDPDFKKLYPEFAAISRFGIGVLSAFMVADDVSVLTVSPNETQARQLNLRDVHGKYLVRLLDKTSEEVPDLLRAHGTQVRLKLRPSARLGSITDLLDYWVVVPGCSVSLSVDGGEAHEVGAASVADALERVLIDAKYAVPGDDGLTTVGGSRIEIRSAASDGIDVAYAVIWSRWLEEWRFLSAEVLRTPDERRIALGTCVGGIRVTEGPAGFRGDGPIALANCFGKSAPRTNVARSALERTAEFDDYLAFIYGIFAKHVSDEMDAFEGSRRFSATMAAREGSYLTEELSGGGAYPEAPGIMRQAIREIPGFVVEVDSVRRRESVADLASREYFRTVESVTVSRLEHLLTSVRGGDSATLGNVAVALGVADQLVVSETPQLCSLSPHLYLGQLFLSEWEISRLITDAEKRTLYASWSKRTEPPAWVSAGEVADLPRSLISLRGRDSQVIGRTTELNVMVAQREIAVEGFTQELVRSHGRILVLSGHPLQSIETTSSSAPKHIKEFVIGWILSAIIEFVRNRRMVQAMRVDEQVLGELRRRLMSAGVFEWIEEASVVSAIQAPLDILDVSLWDQRDDQGWF